MSSLGALVNGLGALVSGLGALVSSLGALVSGSLSGLERSERLLIGPRMLVTLTVTLTLACRQYV